MSKKTSISRLPRNVDFNSQADVSFAFSKATEGIEAAVPTFSIRAYNGGALKHPKFPFPVVVDLKTLSASKSRPALLDHATDKRVGHTTDIKNQGTHLDIDGIVSATTDAAKEVVASSRNGFPWQASIGVYFSRPLELIKAGRKISLNGRTFDGPVLVAREAVFREITFTALGVDDDTSAQIAASLHEGERTMDPKFLEWLQASHLDAEELNEKQLESLEASWKQITATPVPDPIQEGEHKTELSSDLKAAADAREYVVGINKICARYDDPEVEIDGNKVDLAAHAIREEWTAEKTELQAMRNSIEATALPAAHIKSGGQVTHDSLEAALLLQQCENDTEFVSKHYDEKTMENATSKRLRSAGLQYLIHECILSSGGSVHPGARGDELIRAYQETCLQAAGGPSTISLPGILSNIANKSALRSYLSVPTTWRSFCSTRAMNDFKTHTSYRLTASGQFLEVGRDGELKSAELTEQSYTNQLSTFGRRYFFNRQDVINDDLSMLEGIRSLMGRQAALALEESVFTLLMSSDGFFHAANNSNLVTSNALSFDGLSAAEQSLMDQTDGDGKPVVLSPGGILVPSSLKTKAERLFKSTELNETTTDDTPAGSTNVHAGKFPPTASPYLNAQGITGSSATTWYMFADPQDMGAMEVGFLNGVDTPTIESQEAPFHVLGFEFRGYFDYGVARGDTRAAVQCTA
jgi:hypothetical protein